MEDNNPHIHRDISWLSFNYRVLQEAKDPSVPLYERLKFLAIYSSNLGEFFRVRIANHKYILKAGSKARKGIEYDPKELIKELLGIVNKQKEEFSKIFHEQIVPELKQHGVHLLQRSDLNPEQHKYLLDFFNNNLIPYVLPIILIKGKVKPFLVNSALYLALELEDKESGAQSYAIVNVPSEHISRFVELPSPMGQHHIMLLDDVVRLCCKYIFPGYKIKSSFSVKLTRDAEIYIDDEYSGDLIAKIKEGISKRRVGPASRLVYDREMPKELIKFLKDSFELDNNDLLAEGRNHNNFDFMRFPDNGLEHLKDPVLEPHEFPALEKSVDIFDSIAEDEHLLYFPYHSYESVVKFFEAAADDPQVTHIKIIQYRVASKSRIMDALMKSAKNGKQVSAFIEAKARFDEEANLSWGEKLQKAGVNVFYSFPGIKVHAKIAMVRRVEPDGPKVYAYLSTGNFHETTAKIYTDFGFFTSDIRITNEAMKIFMNLEQKNLFPYDFKHLGVGQYNLRPLLKKLVEQEIENAKNGKPAKIILKMNSLQDPEMIQLLYKASGAGVKIDLIVRGICCLIPGIKGVSENICAVSIVDRFLEHARVFIFHNDGDEKIYLSSADWMTRNLHHRIESMFPIYAAAHKKFIRQIIDMQLNDNVKARSLLGDQNNDYINNDYALSTRSQIETYYYVKRVIERAKIKTLERKQFLTDDN